MRSLLAAVIVSFAVHAACQTISPAEAKEHTERQIVKVEHEISASGVPFHATWNSLAAYRTPDWFRDAKFGIFLHWGVYSVPAFGNEWYSRNMYVPGSSAYRHHVATYGPQSKFGYKDFIPMFKAEHFNANAWVDLFVKAGARYVVPVGEHCDGFAMYDSDITPWNAARMGPHRDVVGELAKATRARGLRFGVSSHTAEHWWWYGRGRSFPSDVRDETPETALLYDPAAPMNLPRPDGTTIDTKEPDPSHLEEWLAPNAAFTDNWLALSTEIVDKYQPDFMYFDWWIGQPAMKSALQKFAAYYYDRSAEHHRQPVLTYKEESMPANAATLDIERGKLDTLRLMPWQTDTSVSIHSWGYAEHDQYRTAKSLIAQLVDTVSKNGNLLLNVGPKADGTIPQEVQSALLQMGEWLRINGEAIYGSRPFAVFGEGPTKAPKDSTQKDKDIQSYTAQDIRYTTSRSGVVLYATALGWPSGGNLVLHTLYAGNPYLTDPICSVRLLGSLREIPFAVRPDGLHLTLPQTPPPGLPRDIAWSFAIRTHCHE
ncbi:alpha-L-fucosidase [Edaphobacter sp. 12200R-103]|uniref:alpha-L-fucosidase n=1 Tax=Edaphobacter sp. 12200R-103 TaxID=2703788 RepID=UPI00192EC527|nr:alpha-L-fucosidase [Edaphobacter sp. 12200R-103]